MPNWCRDKVLGNNVRYCTQHFSTRLFPELIQNLRNFSSSVKSLSGYWNDSGCQLGGLRSERNNRCLQAAFYSCVTWHKIGCKPHVVMRWNLSIIPAREKWKHETKTIPTAFVLLCIWLCSSYSITWPAISICHPSREPAFWSHRWWFVGKKNNK